MPFNALFTEKQKFTQWWIWMILIGVDVLILYAIITQIGLGLSFGNNPMSDAGLILVGVLSVLISLFFLSIRLETRISSEGIHVRFYPFHASVRDFLWEDIERAYVRTYKPISEYGGWGLRIGLSGKGKAYNIAGNKGLQIDFRDGKKLLIGTQKEAEVIQVLDDLGKGR